ncbi:MAG: sigma-70 family RNA polymerase sigma factor [Phycisphaerales bacterium]|jgi:RNA polymerase primary sigma factor|nr:sigma-70 family RNA polymerase sigma factor [Phycisphaerales bacterium]
MTYSFAKITKPKGRKALSPQQQDIYRAIPESVEHVHNESFQKPSTERTLFETEHCQFDIPQWTHFPEVPEDNPTIRTTRKALTKQQESQLFLRFNYARYRLGELVEKQTKRFSLKRSEKMIQWYQRMRSAQDSIVDANMALVMAMARRTRIPFVTFPELVSEGNMALLRAIEKFDVARGFKFSTYACRAILKGYNRMATRSGRYHRRFPTEFDPQTERSDYDVKKHEIQLDNALGDLRQILTANRANLSEVEQTIVTQRFALTEGSRKKTLNEVGQHVGLTTERVRQIQKKALAKLKKTMNREYLAI